jgi:hypothetical protein
MLERIFLVIPCYNYIIQVAADCTITLSELKSRIKLADSVHHRTETQRSNVSSIQPNGEKWPGDKDARQVGLHVLKFAMKEPFR